MKKVLAVIVSVLFYIVAFMSLFVIMLSSPQWHLFIIGFPLAAALYFMIAGNIFYRRLHLNRIHLWLSMNFIGYPCSLILLLICFPAFLYNGFIFFIIMPVTIALAVVWIIVGFSYQCVRLMKRRTGS